MILNKVLDKIKDISGIKQLDYAETLINDKWWMMDDQLAGDIILKIIVLLITCIIKDGDKLYARITLEEAWVG